MKGEKTAKPDLWTVLALTAAVLLGANFLAFLLLLIFGVGLLLLYALELGVTTSVLLLLGIAVYLAAKRKGLKKRWRRLLLAALLCNGLACLSIAAIAGVLILYALAV